MPSFAHKKDTKKVHENQIIITALLNSVLSLGKSISSGKRKAHFMTSSARWMICNSDKVNCGAYVCMRTYLQRDMGGLHFGFKKDLLLKGNIVP